MGYVKTSLVAEEGQHRQETSFSLCIQGALYDLLICAEPEIALNKQDKELDFPHSLKHRSHCYLHFVPMSC